MTDAEREELWSFVEEYGLDKTFRNIKAYELLRTPISCAKFHKLVQIYNTVAAALEDYVKPGHATTDD